MKRSPGLFPNMPLRSKLLWSNLLIAFLAITGMAYYILSRAQTTNSYLTQQLNQSVSQETESKLNASAEQNATKLNNSFAAIKNDLDAIQTAAQSLLSQESALIEGNYWDARKNLIRLAQGSWDNFNSEKGSIFIPSRPEIPDTIVSELNALRQIDFIAPPILQRNQDTIAIYFGSLQGETLYYPNIDLATILPPDFDITQRPWFIAASAAQNPDRNIVWSAPYQDAALHGLVITSSVPLYDYRNKFRGVIAMDMQLTKIAALVSNIHIGETGYAFLMDKEGRVIAMPEAGYKDFGLIQEEVAGGETLMPTMLKNAPKDVYEILAKMTSGQKGVRSVALNGVDKYIVYQPLPSVNYSLGLVVPKNEMNAVAISTSERITNEAASTLRNTILLIIGVLAISFLASLWIGNTITLPLTKLTDTARQIADGNLNAAANAQTSDEIGILAGTLNAMTGRLRELVNSLEQRVAERTVDLEIARQQTEKRALELQAIGEISGIITSEQKVENLLPLITRLVSERLNFYHVGIFLVDETKQFAVLQSANSEGGKNMLARGHKLEVGATGLVGYVAQAGKPRIALDVGMDAVFFNNPDLPDTRSEMALPLVSRAQIIGVLDVQSDQPGAFTENNATTLGILADQIATAIENARLFSSTQQALSEAQALYGQYVKESWNTFAKEETLIGYHQTLAGGHTLTNPVDSDEIRQAMNRGSALIFHADGATQESAMVVPVKLRGQVIGALNIKAPAKNRGWSSEEIDLAEAISERLSIALENARLIQDSQRQAIKEQTIGEVTARIGASINMRNVLQTAVEELGRAIPGSEVVLQIDPGKNNK